jgi:cardiolipin synthase
MLKEYGIDAVMFAPITPFMSIHYNYRDHRKIVVIDGIISYTGGINLADEYIDEKIRFGKWVDSGIRFEGEATKDFIYMFYQMYTTSMGVMDLEKYLLSIDEIKIKSDSVVMPFGDCPIDSEKICENIIIDTLYKAKKYVHITTPYLILDQELENALCFTAKRGIDVVIIVPGVPDKKIPYILAKTHYKKLITAGVKIYECNGSFVHAKDWIADDTFAMCGSVNLDYRSLYHHFECGACIYNDKTILDMNNHFNDILSQSTQVSIDSIKKRKIITKVLGVILKILAPLL